jgi:hypothetical protein
MHPLVKIATKSARNLCKYAAEFGITPGWFLSRTRADGHLGAGMLSSLVVTADSNDARLSEVGVLRWHGV